MDPSVDPAAEVTITPYRDGPLLVRGPARIAGVGPTGGRTVALCRCGRSGTKPLCDGTHKVTGFRAPGFDADALAADALAADGVTAGNGTPGGGA